MEKQNLPWKDPAVQFHLERQRCVIFAQKLNIQVLNRGNTPSEMSQVILAKSGVSVTSPFHTSGREYYLPFHNTDCKQTSGKLPQLNPNQFLDLLKHFHKQIFFLFLNLQRLPAENPFDPNRDFEVPRRMKMDNFG